MSSVVVSTRKLKNKKEKQEKRMLLTDKKEKQEKKKKKLLKQEKKRLLEERNRYIPDDIWRNILDVGIKSKKLSYKDLCCLSLTGKRFDTLSSDDSLWSQLLCSDFPDRRKRFRWISFPLAPRSFSTSVKSHYESEFEIQKKYDRPQRSGYYPWFYSHMIKIAEFEYCFNIRDRLIQRDKAEKENIDAMISSKIEEELAQVTQRRKPIAAEYSNSHKGKNRTGYARVPGKNHAREKRTKALRRQKNGQF